MVKIKPYNIFNISGQGIISRLIRNGRGEFYSHCGIFESKDFKTNTWTTWEALGSKIKKFTKITDRTIPSMEEKFYNGNLAIYDFDISSPEEKKRAQDWLVTHNGDKYDYIAIISLTIKTLLDILFKTSLSLKYSTKKKIDCSEAVIRFLCYVKQYDEFKVKNLLKINTLDMCTPQHIDKFYKFFKNDNNLNLK